MHVLDHSFFLYIKVEIKNNFHAFLHIHMLKYNIKMIIHANKILTYHTVVLFLRWKECWY